MFKTANKTRVYGKFNLPLQQINLNNKDMKQKIKNLISAIYAPGAPDNVPQPAPADNVPAVVPVVTISAPAAPVSPVIGCVLNHCPATL